MILKIPYSIIPALAGTNRGRFMYLAGQNYTAMERTVSEAIAYRRSVRIFREEPIDTQSVRQCLENATLAPTSSNLQLWEFMHITSDELLSGLTTCCMDQNAAKTAKQMVVVLSRRDLWRSRAADNIAFVKEQYGQKTGERWKRREKRSMNYYGKLMPFLYTEFLGIFGALKYILANVIGLFRPMYRQVRRSDLRIVSHKSAALAAENFMVSMAAIGYDTCPMEGFDSLRIKKLLKLPSSAEITMVIGCGLRDEKGVYGPRFRVPFEKVYTER
jgi:nitroreductase